MKAFLANDQKHYKGHFDWILEQLLGLTFYRSGMLPQWNYKSGAQYVTPQIFGFEMS